MSAPAVKKIAMLMSQLQKRNQLAAMVFPLVGEFDCSDMKISEVAKHACSRLGLQSSPTQETVMLRGFLAGYERARQDVMKALHAPAEAKARS